MFVIVSLLFAAIAFPIWVLLTLLISWKDYGGRDRFLVVISLGLIVVIWLFGK